MLIYGRKMKLKISLMKNFTLKLRGITYTASEVDLEREDKRKDTSFWEPVN